LIFLEFGYSDDTLELFLAGKAYRKGRFSTVDLLIRIAYFVKKIKNQYKKGADLS
jgi:hypothetical protein